MKHNLRACASKVILNVLAYRVSRGGVEEAKTPKHSTWRLTYTDTLASLKNNLFEWLFKNNFYREQDYLNDNIVLYKTF